jgi:hypothetical protein
MTEQKKFDEGDLVRALEEVGPILKRKVNAYLIGGCAMTFLGAKLSTKDIDVVLTSTEDVRDLSSAMQSAGFFPVRRPSKEYVTLGTWIVLENSQGMRFDLFDRQVCRALEIGEEMKSRARFYRSFGNLDVYLMSPEDIMLFKGITERKADLDDMRVLAERGIDWSIVERECMSQKSSGQFADALGTKLLELKSEYGIDAPIIKSLTDHGAMSLLERSFRKLMGERRTAFNEIARAMKEKYGYSESWTRKQLDILVKKGVVRKERSGRTALFSFEE